MLALPFADSDDFQGGISTANATIQIQMTGHRNSQSTAGTKLETVKNDYNYNVAFGQPSMIITQDCLLKIWSFKSSTRKQIEITNETIEQIALSI